MEINSQKMYRVILQKKWKSLKKQLIKNVKDYHNQNGVKNNDNTGFLHSTNNSYFPCLKLEKLLLF